MISQKKNSSENARWSDELIAQTSELMFNLPLNIGQSLHMKNINGKFGKISFKDLLTEKWVVINKATDESYCYSSCDEMIRGGWVID
jgi:hypothetical protein